MVDGNTHAAVITMDRGGAVIDFSAAAERLFGYDRDEAVGRQLSDLLIPPRLRAAHEAGLHRYVETGEAVMLDAPFRMPALRRDGRELDVEVVVSRFRHQGADAFVGFVREVIEPAAADGELLMRAEFFRALIEHSPILVAVLDEAGEPIYESPSAAAVFDGDGGARGARFAGEFTHPDDRAQAGEAVRLAMQGKLAEPAEFRLRDRDGAWRAVSVQARDLRRHPAVHGTAFYASDITRARAAELRERVEYTRLLTLVESLKVGVLLQDEHRRVVLANSAFVEMFEPGALPQLPRLGPARINLREYALFADPTGARNRADEVVRHGRPLFGDEVALVDGRILERDYVPITLDGSTLGHLWVFRDVTAHAEIRRTLQERNRILTELSALKTEFVAVLSHELRTPLTSIATFAGMLDGAADLDPAEHRAAVGAIRRNADRMLSLVADLLLLARLESGECALSAIPVDLAQLVRAASPTSDGVPDGPRVAGDEGLLRELLDTVVGVLSGISGGIQLHAAPNGSAWVIQVHAATTEPATTERLLSTRLPHPSYPGEHRTGALALMLARAIAARHGGSLSTLIGPGTVTVTVTIPVAASATT